MINKHLITNKLDLLDAGKIGRNNPNNECSAIFSPNFKLFVRIFERF